MLTSISNTAHKFLKKIFSNHFEKGGFITYANNIQWFVIAKVGSLFLSFFTTIVVARIFGPEQFGILNYVLSIVGLFSVFANLGISQVVYREITLQKERRDEILGSAIFLNTITAISTVLLVYISLLFINESLYVKYLILLLSISFVLQPLTLLSYDFLKDREAKYVTITQISTLFIASFLKILIVYYFVSVTFFIAVLVLENLVAGFIYIYQIRKIKRRSLSLVVNKGRVFSIFYMSLPLILFSSFSEIYSRIDQIMLRSYLDIKAVGIYSASVRLTEIWYLVPNILLGALFPALANVKNDDKEYRKRYNMLLSVLVGSALFISFVVFFLRDYIVKIVYGSDFIAAAPVLGVYIFSILGFFISLLVYQDLFLRNNKWAITLLPFLTAILNIILNMILIPKYGMVGAAVATVVSYNIVAVGFYFTIRTNHQ